MKSTLRLFSKKYNVDRISPKKLNLKTYNNIILPQSVDLRYKMSPIYNQGDSGSCSSQAIAAIFDYEDNQPWKPSRLFHYYNERMMEGSINSDQGASLIGGMIAIKKYGICPEDMWPYDMSKFAIKPSKKCYKEALKNNKVVVANIQQDVTSIKTSLAYNDPFVAGIQIYDSFYSDKTAKTGLVKMPNIYTEQHHGGHAIVVCGFIEKYQLWICRNSWGEKWGEGGYFYLPYLYLLDSRISSDLWSIKSVDN